MNEFDSIELEKGKCSNGRVLRHRRRTPAVPGVRGAGKRRFWAGEVRDQVIEYRHRQRDFAHRKAVCIKL